MNVIVVAMPVDTFTLKAAVGAAGAGGVDVEIVTAAEFDGADSPALLNAVTRTLYVPAAPVGVPLIVPVLADSVRPSGSGAAESPETPNE